MINFFSICILYIMQSRYTKYKTLARVQLFGDDDLFVNNTTSQYVSGQSLSNFTVNSGGSGYSNSSNISVIINGGGGSNATASATVSGGSITAVTITNPGFNYTSKPTINFIDAGGGPGVVTGSSSLVGGTGYNGTPPTIRIAGNGNGAIATAILDASGYAVSSIVINSGGQGYTNATFIFSGACTTTASATVTLSTGTMATVSSNGPYINAKRCRFNLNSAFNDLLLSKNARVVMEATYFPTLTNVNNYVIVRLVTSTEDKVLDSKKFTNGNPILLTFKGTNSQIYNCSEFFYNLNVPPTFLNRGYIDLELESPIATANIDFITGFPLYLFFITLIIIDEDDDETMDYKLRPHVDLKNYGQLGMSIKPHLTT